ncbi:MAG: CRISPR-associated protein Cas4 [Fimbriimonadaceae bacterium]
MVSALEHYSYCPRQFGLIHIDGVFDENASTVRGSLAHDRVDEPTERQERGKRVERAMPLYCDRLGLTGRADVVEFDANGVPCPVEYKSGKKKRHPHAEVQLAAQALCLEEMLETEVPQGALYFLGSRQRVAVEITPALRERAESLADTCRQGILSGELAPAREDARCRDCSLYAACQPWVPEAIAASQDEFALFPEEELP